MKHIGTISLLIIAALLFEIIYATFITILIVTAGFIFYKIIATTSPESRVQKSTKRSSACKKRATVSSELLHEKAHRHERRSINVNPFDNKRIINDIKNNGGLIIDKPWLDLILNGQKTWEMRSNKFKQQGYIALIEKGTKSVLGIARIDGYSHKLSINELEASEKKHRVPASLYSSDNYKWFVAMKLSHIIRFNEPIPYQPIKGAVIWVKLGKQDDVMASISKKVGSLRRKTSIKQSSNKSHILNVDESKDWVKNLIAKKTIPAHARGKLPVAKDGTIFLESNTFKDGLIHLKKGNQEYRFESYKRALSALRRDSSLQWRSFKANKQGWKKASSWQKP